MKRKQFRIKQWLSVILISIFISISSANIALATESRFFNFLNYFINKGKAIIKIDKEIIDAAGVFVTEEKVFQTPETIKGIYLTVNTVKTARFETLINQLIESGGNAVVIDIEHGGGLLAFRPENEWLKSINPGSDTLNHLPELIDELHEKGIYVIARQVVFNDPYVGARKPEWRIKNIWGGLHDARWLDPSMAGVQNYNLYTMVEAIEMGFDEIQFDYIRFPADNHSTLDYHYDESSFSRSDVIIDFLKKARKITDEYGTKLSVDVFGAIVWGNIDWKGVGQDPVEIAKYVDAIYPMTYPSHVSPGYYGHNNPYGAPYSFVFNSIEKFVEKADGKAEIRTWIQGFPLRIPYFGAWFMNDQVKATFDGGGAGYIIWSPGNYYTYSWPSFEIEPPEPVEEEVITDEEEMPVEGEASANGTSVRVL